MGKYYLVNIYLGSYLHAEVQVTLSIPVNIYSLRVQWEFVELPVGLAIRLLIVLPRVSARIVTGHRSQQKSEVRRGGRRCQKRERLDRVQT